MLEELKNRLKITYDDETIDKSLELSIVAGKSYLENIAGVPLDFEGDSFNKTLLFEYCRYDYNNAFEYFELNFEKALIQLQIKSVVKGNA